MRAVVRPVHIAQANNPRHLGGAIDADAALKAARFMELCDGFDLPIVTLVDTPGFMVGPESEKQATVRKFCRLFVVGAGITVPLFAVVIRKARGGGAGRGCAERENGVEPRRCGWRVQVYGLRCCEPT